MEGQDGSMDCSDVIGMYSRDDLRQRLEANFCGIVFHKLVSTCSCQHSTCRQCCLAVHSLLCKDDLNVTVFQLIPFSSSMVIAVLLAAGSYAYHIQRVTAMSYIRGNVAELCFNIHVCSGSGSRGQLRDARLAISGNSCCVVDTATSSNNV